VISKFLVAGLGNPGKAYENTRHNIGFATLVAFAKKHSFQFSKQLNWKSLVAKGAVDKRELILMMPQTFMNESGNAIAPLFRYLGLQLSCLLVVIDDIALPFGQMRMRGEGSSGGHNGLKSIESQLETRAFARLRIGVGDRKEGDLSSHVLGRFSDEERKLVPEILQRAGQAIEIWLEKGLNHAMDYANRKNPSQ
jgi:PTH1 family peptidyl-tRNA hydrolase